MSNEAVFPQCENWTEAWLCQLRLLLPLSRSPNEQEYQHVPMPRQAVSVSQNTSGQVLPGEALTTKKALQIKPPTWKAMSSKPTSAVFECPQHLWLCLRGAQGCPFRALAAPLTSQLHPVRPSCCFWQRGLWELLSLLLWAGFPSSHRVGSRRTLFWARLVSTCKDRLLDLFFFLSV